MHSSKKWFPVLEIAKINLRYNALLSIAVAVLLCLVTPLLICVFTVYMKLQSCDVTPVLAFGTIADAIFLGSMGMLTSALTGNTVIGYMPPLLYYVLNIGMGPKLRSFYLFSMVTGNYTANCGCSLREF